MADSALKKDRDNHQPIALPLPGYQITELLFTTQDFIFYRGKRLKDNQNVVIKRINQIQPLQQLSQQLKRQYEIIKEIHSTRIVKPIELVFIENQPTALIWEDEGQELLSHWIGRPMEVESFLTIALSTAKALYDIHQSGFIHRDIRPDSILVHPLTKEVKIRNFWLMVSPISSDPIKASNQRKVDIESIEGTLTHISPEQTGKVNVPLDFRTDFYSLGITFYQMITGHLPFEAHDPLEWIHCHIARTPPPVDEEIKGLPKIISKIISKLLEKSPEDRYQSDHGLIFDLESCIKQWKTQHQIELFPLDEKSRFSTFRIPQLLLGRNHELSLLQNAFDRVKTEGKLELFLISGEAGIGKTSLVTEFRKQITDKSYFFITGKIDQSQKILPYFVIIQAFQKLISEILSKTENEIQNYAKLLEDSVGSDISLLYDLIPQLRMLVGERIPISSIPSHEGKNHFNRAFIKLTKVIASSKHPLILFLDDLQWADSASMLLIHDLINAVEIHHLLIIGAYRKSEIDEKPSLLSSLQLTSSLHTQVTQVTLTPLSKSEINELLTETFYQRSENIDPLGELIHQKTAGNPFFINQFVNFLYIEKLITFNETIQKWRWQLDEIKLKNFTDNVLDFMLSKMNQYDKQTRELLGFAACIGQYVGLNLIASIQNKTKDELNNIFLSPIQDGLLIEAENEIFFPHDRVQQASYLLLDSDQKKHAHLKIGNYYLANYDDTQISENIFQIVNHLNQSRNLITERSTHKQLAKLNLMAGKKSKKSTAYGSAVQFLETALSLINNTYWKTDYQLIFEINLENAICQYFQGNLNYANKVLTDLKSKAKSNFDKVEIYKNMIEISNLSGNYPHSLDLGKECLKLFKFYLPVNPSQEQVSAAYQMLKNRIHQISIPGLLDLPLMTDRNALALMKLLDSIFYPTFMKETEGNEFTFFTLIMIALQISLDYGNTGLSSTVYACFSLVMLSIGDRTDCYPIAKIALSIADKINDDYFKALTYLYYSLLAFWFRPVQEVIEDGRKIQVLAKNAGDVALVSFGNIITYYIVFFSGTPLSDNLKEIEDNLLYASEMNLKTIIPYYQLQKQFVLNLQGKTNGYSSFSSSNCDESMFSSDDQTKMTLLNIEYYIRKMNSYYLYKNYKEAIKIFQLLRKIFYIQLGLTDEIDYYFYSSLTIASVCSDKNNKDYGDYSENISILKAHQNLIKKWADDCPANFSHISKLIDAEVARLDDEDQKAMKLYEEAIYLAKQGGFIQHLAVAYEVAATFYDLNKFNLFAETYRHQAHFWYERWGAAGKVSHMEREFPFLRKEKNTQSTITLSLGSEELDFMSVVKSLQAISGEIVSEKLIKVLFSVLMEQGGAQRGVLLMNEPQNFESPVVYAEIQDRDLIVQVHKAEYPLLGIIPLSVVEYVKRTHESIILETEETEEIVSRFRSDPYFLGKRNLFAVCFPLIRENKVVGVCYLENNLISGRFTSEKLSILELLGSQAAIALENASLYDKLGVLLAQVEESLRMREEFILIASHELRTPLTPLQMQIQLLKNIFQTMDISQMTRGDEFKKMIQIVDKQVERLALLVKDLLDITKINAGKNIELSKKNLNFSQLTESVIDRFQIEAKKSNSELLLDIQPDVEMNLDGDRIDQVISNLLSNAIKFGAGKPIEIHLKRLEQEVQLSIKDSGIGIKKEDQNRLFNRFERAVSFRAYGGLGLGLFISRQIVEAHGGEIALTSEAGKGATFIVKLPLNLIPI